MKLDTFLPSISTTKSPCLIPALAAGPFSLTNVTRTPSSTLSPANPADRGGVPPPAPPRPPPCGRSASVSSASFVSDPRLYVSLTLSPTFLASAASVSWSSSWTFLPSIAVTTSSAFSPALAAGPSSTTRVSLTPPTVSSPNRPRYGVGGGGGPFPQFSDETMANTTFGSFAYQSRPIRPVATVGRPLSSFV